MRTSNWKKNRALAGAGIVCTSLLLALPAQAGDMSSEYSYGKSVAPQAPAPAPVYEAGRGLITLEGPTGMFINPTSATLPQGMFTAQYCFFLPDNSFSDTIGHGFIASYGLTDWFELGAQGNYVDLDSAGDISGAGAFGRVRLLKDEGIDSLIPQLSLGGFSLFSDTKGLERWGMFLAAYKRVPFGDENGFFKALGFHAGVKQKWLNDVDGASVYFGSELQMPWRLYAVGEVATRNDDLEAYTPYSFGIQWRAGGINISVAGIEDGNVGDPGFYFGIGTGLQF